jgi:hypothetical protein
MSNVKVINIKFEEQPVEGYIYCGRGSQLGNPYSHIKSKYKTILVKDRDEACDRYEEYFKENLLQDLHTRDLLNRMRDFAKKNQLVLGCYCKPHKCHCDTIKDWIDKEIEKEE